MAADPKKDPFEGGAAEDAAVTSPHIGTGKRKSPLLARDLTVGRVSGALDAFITKANEELVDVADNFDPEKREQLLQREVADLQRQVATLVTQAAEAEARAAATRAAAEERSPRWAGVVIAFLVGCAATFGLTLVLAKDPPAPTAAPVPLAAPVAPPAAPPTPQPPTKPVVTPIEQQQPTTPPAVTQEPPPVTQEPPAATNGSSTPPGATPNKPPKVKRPPRDPGTRPPAGSAAGSDTLYNPF